MKSYPFSYSWQINSAGTPPQLWPYISDSNRFFKDMGQHPVQEAVISHDLPRHFAQLEYNNLRRADIWKEEPYQWQAPHFLKIKREYQRGPYENLHIKIELNPLRSSREKGTAITIHFEGVARGFMGSVRTKRHFSAHFRRKLKKIIQKYDDSIVGHRFPEGNRPFWKTRNPGKWSTLLDHLTAASKEPELSRRIIEHLRFGDEQDLKVINPIQLAKMWAFPLHRVLETGYQAVLLNIMNMEWRQICPTCRRTLKISRKLDEISSSHYCRHCGDTVHFDLNNSTQLVFKCHPLIRKLSEDTYCVSGPHDRDHVLLQQYIQPGTKHFVQLNLPKGDFRVRTDTLDRDMHVKADINGLDNVTMTLEKGEGEDDYTPLNPRSDMIIKNRTDNPLLVSVEDTNWAAYGVSAAEVTSQQLFRDCFPKEQLRPSLKMKCTELSVLFTDLIDSASIYTKGGDEEAISRVMDHFEVLRQIIREERGAVVKTIGDAIMAVFRKPDGAVRAYRKAQKYFSSAENAENQIKLKGGLHCGNCYAVTLNNRIDYFGNTVNFAARLVEKADSDELVISDTTLAHKDLQRFLMQDDIYCDISGSESKIKGFGDKLHPIRRLNLQKPAMKLVI
ncbi:adenylate/guanylate cyclase domain-containing protein [Rhodohalobacter sp. SW132]|uniref:adenylate/guanylate cyclase domain-containing protein n=1 Tax=Rhodohalobacter sp. SW132 TaxID=2293433 RepID=UPI000E26C964|nr:adenylate/guanylate cyclase domain-containing protein [Rhodohalobacter sp. SW132]REL33378.1 adenylate/guanylate cyclase domain-containing protein [Rhodohalobacter sp. SW132]